MTIEPRSGKARRTSPELPDRFIDRHEAARFLGLSTQILRADVVTNKLQVPRHKFGGAVRYSLRELQEWIEQRRVKLPGKGRAA